ncbi:unnamed protein product [Effrenium voratum]|nr:unnamed protein product [Effrenium voratum]
MATDSEDAKADYAAALRAAEVSDHHGAMVAFSRAMCLAGEHSTLKATCARGVRQALQNLQEHQSGKFDWTEMFKADPAALLGASKGCAAPLPVAGYSKPVRMTVSTCKGRGLVVCQDVEIGELLFVDKAWVLQPFPSLLHAASVKLRDSRDAPRGLFHGGDDQRLPETLPRLAEAELRRTLQFNAIHRWACVDGELSSELSGLWPLAAFVNHSCRPNVNFTFVGDLLLCRATRKMKAGEELFASYVRLDRPLRQRRSELSATYEFHCTCARCILEEAFLDAELVDGFMTQIKALTKAPGRKDQVIAWAESWSFLYRQIEYEVSLAIKQRGKELDEDLALSAASDQLFSDSWTDLHEEQREERLRRQEELRQNIARLQGQQDGRPVNYSGPGREDVYGVHPQRLLCGSFCSVAAESARLWRRIGAQQNCARDCRWICQQLEESAPATQQHGFWATEWTKSTWKAFLKKEEAQLLLSQRFPDLCAPTLPADVRKAAEYAKLSLGRCYGGHLWLQQSQLLKWPPPLQAAALQKSTAFAPVAPRKKSRRPKFRHYASASVRWKDFPKGQVLTAPPVDLEDNEELKAAQDTDFLAALQSMFKAEN